MFVALGKEFDMGHLFKELKTLQEYIIDSILTFLANIFMSKSNISS